MGGPVMSHITTQTTWRSNPICMGLRALPPARQLLVIALVAVDELGRAEVQAASVYMHWPERRLCWLGCGTPRCTPQNTVSCA